MEPQAGYFNVLEGSNQGGGACMDGERPTMIRGLGPARSEPMIQCPSPASYLMYDPTVRQRVVAGLWFGAAAAFPGFLVMVLSLSSASAMTSDVNGSWQGLATLLLMPGAVGALCGAWLGGQILSHVGLYAGGNAFKTGARVTFFSMIGVSAVVATAILVTSHSSTNPMVAWCEAFIGMSLLSLLCTGWFLIPFGGIAGYLLLRCGEWDGFGRIPRRQAPTVHTNPARPVDNRTLSFPAARVPVSPSKGVTLANCSGCGRIVSRAAVSCPRCGWHANAS